LYDAADDTLAARSRIMSSLAASERVRYAPAN